MQVGQHYLADGWGQQLMTLGAFLENHILKQQQQRGQQQQQQQQQGQQQQAGEVQASELAAAATAAGAHGEESPSGDAGQSQSQRPPPLGYLAQHPLFDQVPALRADIAPPDYCSLGEDGEVRRRLTVGSCWLAAPQSSVVVQR